MHVCTFITVLILSEFFPRISNLANVWQLKCLIYMQREKDDSYTVPLTTFGLKIRAINTKVIVQHGQGMSYREWTHRTSCWIDISYSKSANSSNFTLHTSSCTTIIDATMKGRMQTQAPHVTNSERVHLRGVKSDLILMQCKDLLCRILFTLPVYGSETSTWYSTHAKHADYLKKGCLCRWLHVRLEDTSSLPHWSAWTSGLLKH